MDERTFRTLELEALIDLLAGRTQSPLGRKRVLALSPSVDADRINRELDVTTETVDFHTSGGGFAVSDLEDPEAILAELQVEGTSLDPVQILALSRLVAVGMDARGQLADPEVRSRYQQLARICGAIPDLRRMLSSVRGKILPTGEIDDNASPELRQIRREINDRRTRIYRNLESLMRDRATSAIQEEIVTVRNGRFVIPVRTDSRGQVPGVMHGLSSSGQTTYVEPLGIIDQNNDLVRLREEEQIEIAKILFEITEHFRSNLAGIAAVAEALSEVDFAQAKARLSIGFQCVRPEMISARRLVVEEARHLLLDHTLRQAGGRIVPISLEMDEAHQTMVISGPNAGGKTVALKAIGLIALMAQTGLHVPARRAVLPIFDQVLADIGDQQSIAANLSTFTAHIRNIAEMASSVKPPALILIDEVGTGTDPDEGAALGIAVVDFFRREGATIIATTHYNPLKTWASQAEGVLNASVEFDEQTLAPTYRLIVGVAGASAGIEIARRMNLPSEILAEARNLIDPEHLRASDYLKRLKALVDEQEGLRAALEEERQATADKYANLDLEFARRDAERRAEFEAALARTIGELNAESAKIIEGLKDKTAAARLKKEAEARAAELKRLGGARLRKATTDSAGLRANPLTASNEGSAGSTLAEPALPGVEDQLNERDRVRIISLNQEGTIDSIDGEVYSVLVGSLRFRARRDELQLVKAAAVTTARVGSSLPRGVSADISVDQSFTPEINVIGTTADEASDRVDKFLDEAYLAAADTVRIVHGHGKGTLRKAIAELLTGHSHVERFDHAPANEGGSGVTVAVLRR